MIFFFAEEDMYSNEHGSYMPCFTPESEENMEFVSQTSLRVDSTSEKFKVTVKRPCSSTTDDVMTTSPAYSGGDSCQASPDSALQPTPSSSSSTPLLPPCRVCGEKASGFHYGVNTCEACKVRYFDLDISIE